jgi:hypothetical protein
MEQIQSKYSIKRYIRKEWVDLLESIDCNKIDIKQESVTLPTLELSVVDLLEKKFNTTIDNLDRITSRSKKNLDKLVNCDKIFNSIIDPVKLDILEKAYSNNFMPIPVIQWIELKGLIVKKINFLNINLTIVDEKITSPNLIDHIIKIIVWLLKISGNLTRPINIYLFLCPEEKHMESTCLDFNKQNQDQCKLSRTNINSGASWGYNWVQIFRCEEVLKVLIHELIHYLVLDVQDHSNKIDSYCSHLKMHKDSNKILVNEAYTEFLAIYMHTIYLSVYKNSGVFDQDIFWDLYLQEEKFTIYQINKIFVNYSIPGIEFFSKPNNFVQYTNVISYFIIKYLFFINTKYFLILYGDTPNTIKLIKYLLARFFKLKIPQVNLSSNQDTSLRMSYGSII